MKWTIFLIATVLLITLACNFNMGSSTGGEVRMDEAGFSAEIPSGYEMSSIFGELSFTQEDADIFEGPNFSIALDPPGILADPNYIMDNIQGSNNIFNYAYSGKRTPVTFGGVSGLAEDFTGITEENGVAIAGRVIVAILPDGREFRFFGHWPVEQKDKMEPVFLSILNSVKFYEPILPTPTP